jgi:hypothetical protein
MLSGYLQHYVNKIWNMALILLMLNFLFYGIFMDPLLLKLLEKSLPFENFRDQKATILFSLFLSVSKMVNLLSILCIFVFYGDHYWNRHKSRIHNYSTDIWPLPIVGDMSSFLIFVFDCGVRVASLASLATIRLWYPLYL